MIPDQAVWQYQGDDAWVLGMPVRGLVREPLAEAYFNENSDDRRGGWTWLVPSAQKRGVAINLRQAVRKAEEVLGVIP